MRKTWTDDAWADYLYWQSHDKKLLERINNLLKDIDRQPFAGIGKPDPLKGNLQGYWSRRINDFNRIVYRIEELKPNSSCGANRKREENISHRGTAHAEGHGRKNNDFSLPKW